VAFSSTDLSSIPATTFKTLSPIAWPCVSLNFLKWSISINKRLKWEVLFLYSLISKANSFSNALLFAILVNASVLTVSVKDSTPALSVVTSFSIDFRLFRISLFDWLTITVSSITWVTILVSLVRSGSPCSSCWQSPNAFAKLLDPIDSCCILSIRWLIKILVDSCIFLRSFEGLSAI